MLVISFERVALNSIGIVRSIVVMQQSACRCKLNSRKIGASSKRINEIEIRREIATKKYFTTDDCNSFV